MLHVYQTADKLGGGKGRRARLLSSFSSRWQKQHTETSQPRSDCLKKKQQLPMSAVFVQLRKKMCPVTHHNHSYHISLKIPERLFKLGHMNRQPWTGTTFLHSLSTGNQFASFPFVGKENSLVHNCLAKKFITLTDVKKKPLFWLQCYHVLENAGNSVLTIITQESNIRHSTRFFTQQI